MPDKVRGVHWEPIAPFSPVSLLFNFVLPILAFVSVWLALDLNAVAQEACDFLAKIFPVWPFCVMARPFVFIVFALGRLCKFLNKVIQI